jgi:polyhydroxybutyrate depolymerase
MIKAAGIALLAAILMTLLPALSASACGVTTDCVIGERTYRIHMPAGHESVAGKVGAIVYSHGYKGTAAGVMRNKSLLALADRLGVALIVGKSSGQDWSLPGRPRDPGPNRVSELDYYDRVIADAAGRFPIDTGRLLATGFSAGGMMTWNLACHRSGAYAGFAPLSGTFWSPVPQTCEGSVANIVHIHGDQDPVVPLAGRPIADTSQGDVSKVIAMYERYGHFSPPADTTHGKLRCQERRNADDNIFNTCLFAGGHSFSVKRLEQAWRFFAEAGHL